MHNPVRFLDPSSGLVMTDRLGNYFGFSNSTNTWVSQGNASVTSSVSDYSSRQGDVMLWHNASDVIVSGVLTAQQQQRGYLVGRASTGHLIPMAPGSINQRPWWEISIAYVILARGGQAVSAALGLNRLFGRFAHQSNTSHNTTGNPFNPTGPLRQDNVDPNTLTPLRDLGSLNSSRMQSAGRAAQNNPNLRIEVNRSGEVIDGHHRLQYAIERGHSVNIQIQHPTPLLPWMR